MGRAQLLRLNRDFVACFAVSASVSAVAAEALSGQPSHLNATLTILAGYGAYYGAFAALFYLGNRRRYGSMDGRSIKKELAALASSFVAGEAVYLAARWPTLYYMLESWEQEFAASIASEALAMGCYMAAVTVLLRKSGAF